MLVKNVTVEKLVDILICQWGLTQFDLCDAFFEGLKNATSTEDYEETIFSHRFDVEKEMRFLYLYILLLSVKMVFNEEETNAIFKMFRDNYFKKIESKLGNKSYSEKWFSRRDTYTKAINSSFKKEKFLAIGSKFTKFCHLKNNENVIEFISVFIAELLKENIRLLKSYRIINDATSSNTA